MGAAGFAVADDAPIVLPGAPGEDVRELSADEAVEIAESSYSPDDVVFMTEMIPHHAQAVEMANLVEARSNHPEITDIAGRIKASQSDEIEFMKGWLSERDQPVPGVENGGDHGEHGGHGAHHGMDEAAMARMGMATGAQMATLAEVEGVEFDRLFLTLMIRHHQGAVRMVEDLLMKPGSAYDPVLFDFTSDITNDQTAEIERMIEIAASLSEDPRAALSAGFLDAYEAIMNLTMVAALTRPARFFD
ncbi:MAG: DUF305 domain-containing protein, partial [Pseudomonadota bacterium]